MAFFDATLFTIQTTYANDYGYAAGDREVAGLFASLSERQVFLVHDINFHRGIAAASGNPIVASLVEMVSALYYDRRRATAERAVDRELRDAADAHRAAGMAGVSSGEYVGDHWLATFAVLALTT